jgi:hypothetical protein
VPKAFFANNVTPPMNVFVAWSSASRDECRLVGRIEVAIARYRGLFHVFRVVSAA